MMPTGRQVRMRSAARLFGGPLIQNNYRGEFVEDMIACVLPSSWRHCAADWSGWDFESSDGVRMQIKQAAALQTWGVSKRTTFSIAPATGYYRDGVEWVPQPGRQAELYVFAWHPRDDQSADHTDPAQWLFYVAPRVELPPRKSISLKSVSAQWSATAINALAATVENAVKQLATR